MKWKQNIQIDLPAKADGFAACDKLRKVEGVLAAHVIDAPQISVKYDNRKVNQQYLEHLLQPQPRKRAA